MIMRTSRLFIVHPRLFDLASLNEVITREKDAGRLDDEGRLKIDCVASATFQSLTNALTPDRAVFNGEQTEGFLYEYNGTLIELRYVPQNN